MSKIVIIIRHRHLEGLLTGNYASQTAITVSSVSISHSAAAHRSHGRCVNLAALARACRLKAREVPGDKKSKENFPERQDGIILFNLSMLHHKLDSRF